MERKLFSWLHVPCAPREASVVRIPLPAEQLEMSGGPGPYCSSSGGTGPRNEAGTGNRALLSWRSPLFRRIPPTAQIINYWARPGEDHEAQPVASPSEVNNREHSSPRYRSSSQYASRMANRGRGGGEAPDRSKSSEDWLEHVEVSIRESFYARPDWRSISALNTYTVLGSECH